MFTNYLIRDAISLAFGCSSGPQASNQSNIEVSDMRNIIHPLLASLFFCTWILGHPGFLDAVEQDCGFASGLAAKGRAEIAGIRKRP